MFWSGFKLEEHIVPEDEKETADAKKKNPRFSRNVSENPVNIEQVKKSSKEIVKGKGRNLIWEALYDRGNIEACSELGSLDFGNQSYDYK